MAILVCVEDVGLIYEFTVLFGPRPKLIYWIYKKYRNKLSGWAFRKVMVKEPELVTESVPDSIDGAFILEGDLMTCWAIRTLIRSEYINILQLNN